MANEKLDLEYFKQNRKTILDTLVKNGMRETDVPYVYEIPANVTFYTPNEKEMPYRAWAVVKMLALDAGAAVDDEFAKDPFASPDDKFLRMKITDPFAMHLDKAIDDFKESLIREGKAKIVDGRFYRVA